MTSSQGAAHSMGPGDAFKFNEGEIFAIAKGTALLLSADGNTLPTEKTHILKRWAEHFGGVLKGHFAISDVSITLLPQVEANADLDPPFPQNHSATRQLSSGKRPEQTRYLLRFTSAEAPDLSITRQRSPRFSDKDKSFRTSRTPQLSIFTSESEPLALRQPQRNLAAETSPENLRPHPLQAS
ncbi:hypothetical protein SprV_0200894400 [Sparganum proliferum]